LFAGHIFAALGIVLLVSESEAFQLYMASHPTLIWTAMFAPFIILYIAHRLGECRRTCPLDYLFLAMFTISLGFACGMVAALTSKPALHDYPVYMKHYSSRLFAFMEIRIMYLRNNVHLVYISRF
jgi:hypothetical protein